MGFFKNLVSPEPSSSLPPTSNIQVPEGISRTLPDPGAILLSIYPREVHQTVEAELNRVRFPGGGYDRRGIGIDKKDGPLGLLGWITAGDWISLQVWARKDLNRGDRKAVEESVATIAKEQGVPAAASWAQRANPNGLRLDDLAYLLSNTYDKNLGNITNGMVIDSIKKWRR